MKRTHTLIVAAAAALSTTACDGLRDAFSSHVDVVARAGGQELSTERLADILGNAQIPVQKDIATVLADVWVSYQLLGHAGARNDSLNDPDLVDEAMWAAISQARISKFYDTVRKTFPPPDTINLEQQYAQASAYAAQHILVLIPQGGEGMSDAKKEEIRRKAEDIRRRTTSANFNAMVKQYSEDPGSKETNGTYAMFPPPQMVPEFENAVRALQPGEITPNLVQTSYGYHIIRRHLVSEVRSQFIDWLIANSEGTARVAYLDKVKSDGKLTTKEGIVPKVKEIAKEPTRFDDDRTVLGSSRLGNFTAADFARWIQAHPQAPMLRNAIVNQMPDSSIVGWVSGFIGQELLVEEAKKQKIELDSADLAGPRDAFKAMVANAWAGLRVDPTSLGDSARTQAEKSRLAAQRADEALEQIFRTNGASYVDVPQQLAWALREKYSARVNEAGIDRALERAAIIRAAADSARAKQAPPMPTMPPGTPPPAGTQPPPPGKQPPGKQ
jgi:peptidyl-prolyl cis-trans isomerase D